MSDNSDIFKHRAIEQTIIPIDTYFNWGGWVGGIREATHRAKNIASAKNAGRAKTECLSPGKKSAQRYANISKQRDTCNSPHTHVARKISTTVRILVSGVPNPLVGESKTNRLSVGADKVKIRTPRSSASEVADVIL